MRREFLSATVGVALVLTAGAVVAADKPAASCPKPPLEDMRGLWALAVTWQPGFCQTFDVDKRPLPQECPTASKMEYMTLHGLWPQWEEYCSKDAVCTLKRDQMPAVAVSSDLRKRLAAAMPGVESLLERHEYYKHGSCSGMNQEAYFSKAVELVDKLNASSFPGFLHDNYGRNVTKRQMCDAIGKALGPNAVAAVEADSKRVKAKDGKNRFYFTELRIWLKGDTGADLDLTDGRFAVVPKQAQTLGPVPSDPLCDDNLDNHVFYIDVPGMDR